MKIPGYAFVVISAATLGIANIFYKKSTVAIGANNTTFWYYLFAMVLATGMVLIDGTDLRVTPSKLLPTVLVAVFLFISVFTFNLGLQSTKVSISSTIRSLSFLVTLVISSTFLRESLSVRQWIGVVLGTAAILLMAL
jgi:drug/metabolite transporter (DMT)-like permease